MQTPFAVSGEQPKISVWLDNKKSNELKKFHCLVCGKVIFEYYNNVRIVMPGEEGEVSKAPIIIQCRGAVKEEIDGHEEFLPCRAKYWIE